MPLSKKSTVNKRPAAGPARTGEMLNVSTNKSQSFKPAPPPGQPPSKKGRRYPEIRQRGYYSDILGEGASARLGNVLDGPHMVPDLLWQARTEKHMPSMTTFQSPSSEELLRILKEQVHGPTSQVIKETDFPERSYEPKVQVPFYTPPGTCPRKIEIERRKREYAKKNLAELLEKNGIRSELLMPRRQDPDAKTTLTSSGGDRKSRGGGKVDPFPPFLALEIFDDEDFDVRTSKEWLSLGDVEANLRKPVPGKALLPTESAFRAKDWRDPDLHWEWIEVGVLDFKEVNKLFLVQKCDVDGRVLDADGNTVVNGLRDEKHSGQFWIPRVQLMFCAEDPENFARRVRQAFKARRKTENLLRYNLYIDCMPMDGLAELSESSFMRMLEWAKGAPSIAKDYRVDRHVPTLKRQVTIDWCRAMNRIIFDKTVKADRATYSYITLPDPVVEKVLYRGCDPDVPPYNFAKQFNEFAFNSLLTREEAIQAIQRVRSECQKVTSMSLFHVPSNKTQRLEEFDSTQSSASNQTSLFLKDSWITTLRAAIRTCLRDVGKGWFNLHETNWQVYQISKLKKFMDMVKFSMQDSLRHLVQDSLNAFVQMVLDACCTVMDLEEGAFVWGADVLNSPFRPLRNALFLVELILDSQGVHYSTNLILFEQSLANLFDKGIQATQNVPQLEKYVLEDMFWSGTPLLESVGLHEPFVESLRDTIRHAIRQALIPMKAYAVEFERYLELMNCDVNQYINSWRAARGIGDNLKKTAVDDEQAYEKTDRTAHEIKADVERHLHEKELIELGIPSAIVVGPFHVLTENVRQALSKKRKALANALLELLARILRSKVDTVSDEFKAISRKLYDKPNTIEDLAEQREWMKSIPELLAEKQERIDQYLAEFELLDEFLFGLPQDDFNAKWICIGWPHKIEIQMEQTYRQLEEDEDRFHKMQLTDQANFNDRLDTLQMVVAGMAAHMDINKAHEIANEVRRINKQLKECQELAAVYNNRERLFGMPVTNYEKLARLVKEFEPFRALWVTASNWITWHDSWMHDPITTVDAESLEKNVNDAYKTMHKSVKFFADIPGVSEVAAQVKEAIEEFKPHIPLIQGLRNPGMRARHWDQLSSELGFDVQPTKTLNFLKCLEMGLQEHMGIITKIAEVAGKEYSIEQALDKMESEWKPVIFEIMPYKDTGTYILKASDETSQLLDDHIVMTQSMSFSPYKKPFEDRIGQWEGKLKMTQDVLDEWLMCQRSWLYLEPIFSSEDINRQLPVESKRYQTMERIWRKVMKNAEANPVVINLCPDARLLDNLRECNKLLEQVQKGLSEYLETKRTSFPRFFFLSDDELLEILSQTKDPTAVQPHLRKCFENIALLNFEEDLRITDMFSSDGEKVPFSEHLYPTGNVEDWLLEVERVMRESLRKILGDALQAYSSVPRTSWVLSWPGQLVIAGCQTHWTIEVTEALEQGNLDELHNNLLKQLDDLRGLVRSQLTRMQRSVLSALIVIEVHARDVVHEMLLQEVKNSNDFEWISQLRYYWISDNLKIRVVNAEFQYGYEYLGNNGRLVITPLTDRCYLTLSGALHLKFGGAPAGPAGTGKTETTKDLGKAMAIQCVVFNCSDQLDYMAMGKFFKGLASAGAWSCFDEFNRIDIEVLSVIAMQISTIQLALKDQAERFIFEGVELVLKQSCAVFITMNPGYAGRTELPDNLKALFRPVAMMVPDYGLIAEISLFSFGFADAKLLALKITTTFKLSSEQLSSQDHYDFGMRAVKTVISAAGNLKRENPNMVEELICLRAIRDVNVPKFLQDDLKLFNGIVTDLFPKINFEEQGVDYGILDASIRKCTKEMGMKDVDGFMNKCIQLYETTVVRHGLMLVGPTGSGKTKCYEVLKEAMTALRGEMSPSGSPFEAVHTYVLNPKSITMGQLYGEFDLMTHEWTDGILSSLIRGGVAVSDHDKRWYVFDGPVDAVWIENMNTVLDDNKKLCLSSGEIIKLSENQTMMFEVMDLAVASPATVSRCGMVYLEPSILGLDPFVECYLAKLPDTIIKQKKNLNKLFDKFLKPAINFLRANVKEIVGSVDSNLTFSLLKLLDCFFAPFVPKEDKRALGISKNAAKKEKGGGAGDKSIPPEKLEKIPELIEPWFIFSLLWSVGATCDNDGRVQFDNWLRNKMAEEKCKLPFPAEGLVYDYRLDDAGASNLDRDEEEDEDYGRAGAKKKEIKWVDWMYGMPDFHIPQDARFSDIIVPTMDTKRGAYVLQMLLVNNKAVLSVGPTGTGKTLTIIDKLTKAMPKDFVPDFIVFSAKTSANQTQDLIDSKLDKRRKGVFGPPLGKYCIFFIDDVNMPALETYGAQPPIELLRQWMDFHGWYDRKSIGDFRHLVDVNFLCAMGPPGGGRNPVTPRLTRHFNYLSFSELQNNSKIRIFGVILDWWLDTSPVNKPLCNRMVQTCISVYSTIQASLLPTPAKSHYTFNLRDLSKVFQGISMTDGPSVPDKPSLLRLWYHENCRVFQDRLVNAEDREWFKNLLFKKMLDDFQIKPTEVVVSEPILFGDFMNPNADAKLYMEITDHTKLVTIIEEYLEDYNQITVAKMRLVLFMDAVKHVCRINRVIRQPLGNALCLGMGGSGRQSLTRLASHMADYDCFQVELSKNYGVGEWREDLKGIMMKTGLENKPLVFLFSDTQIKSESFLEDLNNILNSGDVPNIYAFDELDQIYTAMKPLVQDGGLQPTKTNLYATYTKRVRSNLHTVITMSPLGEVFRARLRQFPALVNCCTIDWFSEWPKDALQSVAFKSFNENTDLNLSEEGKNGLVMMCQEMHQSVSIKSLEYKEKEGRFNYVTPTSFLELLNCFRKLNTVVKSDLVNQKNRLKTGLDKLMETQEEVAKLQQDLEFMKPMLEEAARDTAQTMHQIAIDTKVAEETKVIVQREEAQATEKAKETQAIADDAQKDLNEALPALDAALQSLRSLNKNDVVEVRAMQRPPDGVRMVMEAVCIMKGVKPKRVQGDKPGVKVDDYWDSGKALLQDPAKFLESLFKYDKDNIPDATIQKIQTYIDSESFSPVAIAKVSKACTSICTWVIAMHKYHFVAKAVAPKRAALAGAQAELAETQALLEAAKARLTAVEEGIATLQAKYNDSVKKKDELERKSQECEDRLIRADKLINGLADEKDRWADSVTKLEQEITSITGSVLVSAAFVAYLGPFNGQFREALFSGWLENLTRFKVPNTGNNDLNHVLGDPVKIRSWQIAGLPKDALSVENGIIVQYSQRWPLFIDPQGQANKWIKNLMRTEAKEKAAAEKAKRAQHRRIQEEGEDAGEKDSGCDVIKLSDRDFLRSLENSIRFGKPCLLENVYEELDPALEPVLLKQTYKQSGTIVIKLGDAIIPWHEDFRFYITTKLPNPHYTPEISTKVTLVNFTLSPAGLEDQLLARVVAEERPDLEEAKNQLIVSNAKMKQELKEIEDKILARLSASEGSPVDDLELIATLEASKVKSHEIKTKVAAAEITEKDIDVTRSEYIPVAVRTQILFFCVSDLAKIDPMYQYSLEWFVSIFLGGIANAEEADTVEERIVNINEYFTFSLYSNVCRSLFEKHKLLFAFLLCVRILQHDGKIDGEEWRYLLAGGMSNIDVANPDPSWISDKMWMEIKALSSLPTFSTLAREFKNDMAGFKKIFDSSEPNRESLPGKWASLLDSFQRLLILRCIRVDKVTNAMQDFVSANLGQRFIEPQTADLSQVFKDSSPTTPLIFVLSVGTDPAADLYKFADEMRFTKKLTAISLGQGQGPRAEAMMRSSMERGKWVFFQNCHLAPSWMPTLERLIEQIDPDKVHRDFRLWLTSMPSPKFPVAILQNSSKMTVEPPRGIKANLLKSYITLNDDFLNSCGEKTATFKHLLLSLCFFHAICLERRKFGPLGFNIPYEFTDGDLRICISQLKMFLVEYEQTPYKVLKYTAGHINYGGRVTDDQDRRTIMTILEDFYFDGVLSEDHKYSQSGIYRQLNPQMDHQTYVGYLRSLPINDMPEVFGLHDNANITFAQNETYNLLNGLVLLQGKSSSSSGRSNEEIIEETTRDILSKVSREIDLKAVMQKYPLMYEESMNTVLSQEIMRYNKLLATIHKSLQDLLKAIKGLVVMSQQLEAMSTSLFINAIPEMWSSKAYPSLKPLASWVTDLSARMAFIHEWIDRGIPKVFWISGFFFPQAFLTGTMQNFARSNQISIDCIVFDFEVLREPASRITVGPSKGVYIRGLFVEGARWDYGNHELTESQPKELYTDMPVIYLIPTNVRTGKKSGVYYCPVYKTLTRAGTLSTTGHSTNFVTMVEVPTTKPQNHWIKRGVALLCALNY